jgi:hypothetical protein
MQNKMSHNYNLPESIVDRLDKILGSRWQPRVSMSLVILLNDEQFAVINIQQATTKQSLAAIVK